MRNISRTKIIEAPMTNVEVSTVMKNVFHLIPLLEAYDGSGQARLAIENAILPMRHCHNGSITTWELMTTCSWILDRIESDIYSAGELVPDLNDNLRTMLDPNYTGPILDLLKKISPEDIEKFLDLDDLLDNLLDD